MTSTPHPGRATGARTWDRLAVEWGAPPGQAHAQRSIVRYAGRSRNPAYAGPDVICDKRHLRVRPAEGPACTPGRHGRPERQASSETTPTPSSASRSAPPSSAVSTTMPSSSTATECSQWLGARAVRGDDGPVVVEHAGAALAADEHRLDRDAQTRPQPRAPVPGAVVEHLGRLVHRAADAVPDVLLDDAVPLAAVAAGREGRVDDVLDGLAHRAEPTTRPPGLPSPAASAAMPAHMARSVVRDSSTSSGSAGSSTTVMAESPCQPSTIAPQSTETTSPGCEHARARDAVHDLVVDRDAQRRGEPVVPEERRRRAGGRG